MVEAVLLHELGHVRRRVYAGNVVRAIVQTAYWPHPLAWLVGRVVGSVREQAVDDLCIHTLGGPAADRAFLLEVASGLVRRPGPSLGLAMANPTRLGHRLAWIDRTGGASSCLLRWPSRLAVALTVVAAAGLLGSIGLDRARARGANEPQAITPKPAAAVAQEPPDSIEVVVRSRETGRAIEGAKVRPVIDQD